MADTVRPEDDERFEEVAAAVAEARTSSTERHLADLDRTMWFPLLLVLCFALWAPTLWAFLHGSVTATTTAWRLIVALVGSWVGVLLMRRITNLYAAARLRQDAAAAAAEAIAAQAAAQAAPQRRAEDGT